MATDSAALASGQSSATHCCYLIMATPRTGSMLLCDLLRQSGVAGQPQEVFSPEHQRRISHGIEASVRDYVRELRDASFEMNGGVLGAKVMWGQLRTYLLPGLTGADHPTAIEGAAALDKAFPGLHVVRLSRRDRVKQAVSYARALATGNWVTPRGTRPKELPPAAFDPDLVARITAQIEQDEAELSSFLAVARFPTLRIWYETLATDIPGTLACVLRFLDRPVPDDLDRIVPKLDRMADRRSEALVARIKSGTSRSAP